MDVPIGTLALPYYGNYGVYFTVKLLSLFYRIDHNQGFQELVKIAIVKRGAYMLSFLKACGNFKIGKPMADAIVHLHLQHVRHHRHFAYLEPIGPKTCGPAHIVQIYRIKFGIRAFRCVHQAFLLGLYPKIKQPKGY
jgi:hypothetical protein